MNDHFTTFLSFSQKKQCTQCRFGYSSK
jgi:hypothetical protein